MARKSHGLFTEQLFQVECFDEVDLAVALCRLSLAWPRLPSRRLVMACEVACKSVKSNLLITRQECCELPVVQEFLHWIRPVAARMRDQVMSFDKAGFPS